MTHSWSNKYGWIRHNYSVTQNTPVSSLMIRRNSKNKNSFDREVKKLKPERRRIIANLEREMDEWSEKESMKWFLAFEDKLWEWKRMCRLRQLIHYEKKKKNVGKKNGKISLIYVKLNMLVEETKMKQHWSSLTLESSEWTQLKYKSSARLSKFE